MLSSLCAVTKTTGTFCRRSASSCWSSGPVMPGMATSRIRHPVCPTESEARKSSADENASTANPHALSSSGSDSRTDSSSSTTETSSSARPSLPHDARVKVRSPHQPGKRIDDAAALMFHGGPLDRRCPWRKAYAPLPLAAIILGVALGRVDTIVQWIRPPPRCLILGRKKDTMAFEKVMYTAKAHTIGDERRHRGLRPIRLGEPCTASCWTPISAPGDD